MPGQMYVLLSRFTSLAGLFLIGNYTKAVFKLINAVANEYDRLRAELSCKFENTSSLVHIDILCFTETQLLPSQDGLDLSAIMDGFYVTYNSNDDRFCSLTLCYRDNLHLFM